MSKIMSVVANSFTKNTHAERALCAQAPKATKASMVCYVPGGRPLLVGALSTCARRKRRQNRSTANREQTRVAFPNRKQAAMHSQTTRVAACH